jgi:hypothetical protein
LLLNELSNFRFLPNETPTALCLRLAELLEELELLPGNAAVTFIDTQKIGYLLNALRHEDEWKVVCSSITSAQIKGSITFREACEELKVRCEADRIHDLLDRPVKGRKVQNLLSQTGEDSVPGKEPWEEKINAFISTVSKRLNLTPGVSELSGEKTKRRRKRKSTSNRNAWQRTVTRNLPFHCAAIIIMRWYLRRRSLLNCGMVMARRHTMQAQILSSTPQEHPRIVYPRIPHHGR